MTRKPERPVRTVQVVVPGEDTKATMRAFTTRDFLALRRGDTSDLVTIDLTLAAVVDFPGDPLDLPLEDLLTVTTNWIAAVADAIVPPPNA